jgi:hypothetical protein
VCTVERESTNTPLQALVTLHAPAFIEASRRLAEIAVQEADPILYAFRAILSRPPDKEERQLLEDLHRARAEHYIIDPGAAAQLLGVGESPVDANLDPDQVAALADVCHVILNLSETITRK